jgi:hypothetical protein
MPDIKTYKLHLTFYDKLMAAFYIGFPMLMTFFFATGMLQDTKGYPPKITALIWGVLILWAAYFILTIPYKIIISNGDKIKLVSLANKKDFSPSDIKSIKPAFLEFGFLTMQTIKGKTRIYNQFDKFHEFLDYLESKNPTVDIRGC